MMKNRIQFIEQMEHSECGLACLAMIMNYYHIPVTLASLRDEYGSTKEGMTLKQLFQLSGEKGMQGKAFYFKSHELTNHLTPAILHWENKHFVVLEKVNQNAFTIVDPAEGRKKINVSEFNEKFTGYLAFFQRIDDTLPIKKKSPHLLTNILLKEKKLIFYIFLVTVIMQLFAIITPIGTKWFTDTLVITKEIYNIKLIIIILFTLFISYFLVVFLRSWMISTLQKQIDISLMSRFMAKLLNLPLQFFENRTTGDLLFRANSSTYIRQILSTTSISVFIDLLLVITYMFIMFVYSVQLSVYLLLFACIILFIMLLNTKMLKKLNDKYVSSQTKVQSLVSESINGILDTKILGREKSLFNEWRVLFDKQVNDGFNLSFWSGFIHSLTTSFLYIIPLFIYGIGGHYVMNNTISLGTLVAFGTISVAFISPIISLSDSYSQIFTIKSYLRRILDVLESKGEPRNLELPQHNLKGQIELSNVSFRYSKYGEKILDNINIVIKPGETVAIVGQSGSGKSTLLKLILGLYYATEGEVKFDNRNIEDYDITFLRKQIGSVLQESKLLNKSIRDNLTLFNENVTDEDLYKACFKSNILHEIAKLSLGFETMISEEGSNFSGGQRQRLLIARALVQPKPILVFDEATSALDTISEQVIEKQVRNLSCTRIIVAHRLSTIHYADRILVLANGKIVEEGTHAQLIQNKGEYYNLYTSVALK